MGYKREHDRYLAGLTAADEAQAERRRFLDEQDARCETLFSPLILNGLFAPRPADWLVEDFLALGYLTVIAAEPKEGKSSLATAIALAVATGAPFAGRQTRQGAVLWLSCEESREERAAIYAHVPEHLKTLEPTFPIVPTIEIQSGMAVPAMVSSGASPEEDAWGFDDPTCGIAVPPMNPRLDDGDPQATSYELPTTNHDLPTTPLRGVLPIYTTFEALAVDNPDDLSLLERWVTDAQARLIVVDPLHGSHSGRSLSDGWAARRTLRLLKNFCARHKVAALVLHHLGESRGKKRVAESPQISATASMFMLMSRTGIEEGEQATSHKPQATSLVRLECQGRGGFANQTLLLESSDPLDYRPSSGKACLAKRKPNAIEAAIKEAIKAGARTAAEIAEATSLNHGTVRNAVTRLRKRNELKVQGCANRRRLYALKRTHEHHA